MKISMNALRALHRSATALALSCAVLAPGLAQAQEIPAHPAYRHLAHRIRVDVKEGKLTPAQAQSLREQMRQINLQARTERQAGGGKLTAAQRQALQAQRQTLRNSVP